MATLAGWASSGWTASRIAMILPSGWITLPSHGSGSRKIHRGSEGFLDMSAGMVGGGGLSIMLMRCRIARPEPRPSCPKKEQEDPDANRAFRV